MEWKPIGDQVLIKQHAKQDKTKSGIILTTGMDDFLNCTVVAIGDGLFTHTGDRIPMSTRVDQEVLIHASNVGDQKKIRIEDEDYILIRESEIAMIKQ
jgi:chaperonin GroES